MCKKLIKNEPQPNFDLLEVVDHGIAEKQTIITIGRVPCFVNNDNLITNLLNRLKSASNLVSVDFQADENSICSEQIVKLTYKTDDKSTIVNEINGKILSISTADYHSMINMVSCSDMKLDQTVRNILKTNNLDLVMLFPHTPALGYIICISGDPKVLTNKPKFRGELGTLIHNIKPIKINTQNVLILYFIEQDDLWKASELLQQEGVKINDLKYSLLMKEFNNFELISSSSELADDS